MLFITSSKDTVKLTALTISLRLYKWHFSDNVNNDDDDWRLPLLIFLYSFTFASCPPANSTLRPTVFLTDA